MEIKKWEEISRETILEKYGRAVDRVVFKLPNGREDEYYLKRELDSVATVIVTPENKIVLVRHFRPGPEDVMWDIPGGYIDKGELPEKAALREVLEETGYSGEVKIIGSIYTDCYSSQKRFGAVMVGAIKTDDINHDENEFMETVPVSIDEFRQMLKAGKVIDVNLGYMALDYLGLL